MGLIFIIGVIVLIWLLVDGGHHHHHHNGHKHCCHHHDHSWGEHGGGPATMTPRQILDERYARGEIDRQEYLDRKKDIEA